MGRSLPLFLANSLDETQVFVWALLLGHRASHGNFLERRSLERGQFVASKLPRDELVVLRCC